MLTRKCNLCSSNVSRKLLHILMAPVYVLCWPLFPNTERGMYCALSIPLMFTIAFWLVGREIIPSDMIVKTMSRSGKSSELAKGPVHYGVIMTLTTLLYWKRIDALFIIMTLSFGDGFAAWVGSIKRWNRPLWWNRSKSWLGLLSYVAFSTVGIIGVCDYLSL
ncbi:hypothetical protein WA588_002742 [Blastocystis sp. NMH]